MRHTWSISVICLFLLDVSPLLAQSGQGTFTPVEAKPVTLTSSNRIRINHAVKNVGSSGIAAIELWYTRDGKEWKKGPMVTDEKTPLIFEAAEEGKYGFTLIVRNRNGLAGVPPKGGDLPQVWVKVTMGRPEGVITSMEAVTDNAVGALQGGADLKRLIDQLGSANFAERQAASRKLDAIGEPALEALHKIAKTGDLETSRRALVLIRTIQRRIFGPLIRIVGHRDKVTGVAFSPDGKLAVSSSDDHTVRLWDVASGKEMHHPGEHGSMALSVAFSPDGKRYVSCSGWPSEENADKSIRLWDTATGNEVLRLEGHTDTVWKVAFSPNGRQIVSASRDNTLRLWDVETGKEVRQYLGHGGWVRGAAFSPDGNTLVSGSWDNSVRLFDVASGKELKRFDGHEAGVNSVAFSPDGTMILSGGGQDGQAIDAVIRLWDVRSGKVIRRYEGHTNRIWHVTFSPDGSRLLSSAADGTIRLWDVQTGQELHAYDDGMSEVRCAMFSPDGRRMISGSHDKIIRIWPLPK